METFQRRVRAPGLEKTGAGPRVVAARAAVGREAFEVVAACRILGEFGGKVGRKLEIHFLQQPVRVGVTAREFGGAGMAGMIVDAPAHLRPRGLVTGKHPFERRVERLVAVGPT